MLKNSFTPLSPERVAEMTDAARAMYEQRYGPVYEEAAQVAAQINERLGLAGAYWSTTLQTDRETLPVETHISPAQLNDIWPYLTYTERLELVQGHVAAAHERVMGNADELPPTVVDSYQTSGGDASYVRQDQEIRVHPQLLRQDAPGAVIPCVDHELAHDIVYGACDAALDTPGSGQSGDITVSTALAQAINANEQAYTPGWHVPLERAIETGYEQAAQQSILYREQPAEVIPWAVHPPRVAAFAANEEAAFVDEEPVLGAVLSAGMTLAAAQGSFQLRTTSNTSDMAEPTRASSSTHEVQNGRGDMAVASGLLALVHLIT